MTPITDERAHRRLRANDACPDCTPIAETREFLSTPYDFDDERQPLSALTPDGDRGGLVTAAYRADDPTATATALDNL